MLSWLVGRIVRRAYQQANAGDIDALTKAFARDVVFEFHGDTRLGGERRGRDGVREWFRQVAEELGRLELTAQDVVVSGPPWNIRVIVRISDRAHLISGHEFENYGFQFLRLRWGKIVEDRILVDLDIVRRELAAIEQAAHGKSRVSSPSAP
ncbi:MAG TPA: nuclear transport factor 2 family protein [Solirubrobacteraceae bacterium]|jgi:ketosteroid isomerase-like protein